jgi:hypothetical protein
MRRMRHAKFLLLQRINFKALHELCVHNINTRNSCWRKILAWRYYTRRAHERREVFRVGFWIFHTWRKMAARSGSAKEKALFLVHRVMPTLVQIKVFRAWMTYGQYEGSLNRTADSYFNRLMRGRAREAVRWVQSWAHQRRWVHKAWVRRGSTMRQTYTSRLVLAPFYNWVLFAHCRVQLRHRQAAHFYAVKTLLLGKRPPARRVSNSERRSRIKALAAKKLVKTRKVSRKELKDRLKQRKQDRRSSSSAPKNTSNSSDSSRGGVLMEGENEDEEESDVGKKSHKGKLSRRSSFGGGGEPEVPDLHEPVSALFRPYFKWGMDVRDCFDIAEQSDEDELDRGMEEERGTGALEALMHEPEPVDESPDADGVERIAGMTVLIQEGIARNMAQLPEVHEVLRNYRRLHPRLRRQTGEVVQLYVAADHWNCVRSALLFHFYAYRAFSNLRHNAAIVRKLRRFRLSKVNRIKRIVWLQIRKSKRNTGKPATPAERLMQEVRDHHAMKANRTRKFTRDVNNILGRDHSDEYDDDKARAYKMKLLNLVDPDDEAYIGTYR